MAAISRTTFQRISMNESYHIFIRISPKYIPMCPIANMQPLVQMMAWHQAGDKPLSEPMLA